VNKFTHPCDHHEGVWEGGDIAPLIINLYVRWKWVISFTLRPLYPWGKSCGDRRRLAGSQGRSERFGENRVKISRLSSP
jgi:hypothetical protein